MKNRSDAGAGVRNPAISYPFQSPPGLGKVLQVAPGVFWIRMPLPFPLDHINLWALEDDDGWTVIDAGIFSDESVLLWEKLLKEVFKGRPVKRVIVTHMHPDHVGMAGWLVKKFGCDLWMTQREYFAGLNFLAELNSNIEHRSIEFYRSAGWSDAALERYQRQFGSYSQYLHEMPASFHRIRDGDEFYIGEHRWRVVVGSGHSPEHACLYCAESKLFISGDQVLPRISSNVSVYPAKPDANPMAEWLASLAKLKREIPDDVLVLPSHNECFYGLHGRITYLVQTQTCHLNKLWLGLAEPKRVVDLFELLFGREIPEANMEQFLMATGESLACLNYLFSQGGLMKSFKRDGACWYGIVPSLDS